LTISDDFLKIYSGTNANVGLVWFDIAYNAQLTELGLGIFSLGDLQHPNFPKSTPVMVLNKLPRLCAFSNRHSTDNAIAGFSNVSVLFLKLNKLQRLKLNGWTV